MMGTSTPMDAFRSYSGSVILSEKTTAITRNKGTTKRSASRKRKTAKAPDRDR